MRPIQGTDIRQCFSADGELSPADILPGFGVLGGNQPGGADQPTHPGQNVKMRRTVDCCLRSAAESWSRTMSATPSSPALSVNSKSVG